jgi:hypothetical protein
MKKLILISSVIIISLALLFTGCVAPPVSGLPNTVKTKLDTAIANWNTLYGTNVQADTAWTYEGTTDVDISDPSSATASLLDNVTGLDAQTISDWEDLVESLIQTGMHLVTISWQKGSVAFTTTCVTDDTDIIYDNILSNAVMVQTKSKAKCFDYVISWLWGNQRGNILVFLDCVCVEGQLIACLHTCTAYMTLGDAKVNCKVTKTEDCCYLDYSWAWATPLVTISVQTDNFTLQTSGIGSSGQGSGSCYCCCEEVVVD